MTSNKRDEMVSFARLVYRELRELVADLRVNGEADIGALERLLEVYPENKSEK